MGVNANSSNADVANTEGCQFLYGLANPSLLQCQHKPLPMLLMLNTNAGNDSTTNASNSKLCPA